MEEGKKRRKHKKLLISLGVLLLLIAAAAGYFYYDYITSSSKQTTVSARAKEFLDSQKFKTNSPLKDVNFTAKANRTNEIERVDGCFSLMIPFNIRNINTDENQKCYRYISFDNPQGSIVLFKQDAKGLGVEAAPGVSMRRLKKDVYKEEQRSVNGKTFLVFRDSEKNYEKTAYLLTNGSYYILTLSLTDPENGDTKLDQVLSSVIPL
ncbi:MAG: hypothetical protein ACM3IJ_04420 [Candidatus Levyibacteriota bacterium]